MVYRDYYRDNVVLPNIKVTKTQLKKCKYPINFILKGKYPMPQNRICFSVISFNQCACIVYIKG